MALIELDSSLLLIVDFQARLVPAIDQGAEAVDNARRLIEAARMLDVEMVFTEQNPDRLGPTVPELSPARSPVIEKMTFDATAAENFPRAKMVGRSVIVAGCEAHVCVLQTVFGLMQSAARVHVVRDAIGSRRPESKAAALERMAAAGADLVTTEMVLFEWLQTADHPRFRDLVRLIK